MNEKLIQGLEYTIEHINENIRSGLIFLCNRIRMNKEDKIPILIAEDLIFKNIDKCSALKLYNKNKMWGVLWDYSQNRDKEGLTINTNINKEKIVYCKFLIEKLKSKEINYDTTGS